MKARQSLNSKFHFHTQSYRFNVNYEFTENWRNDCLLSLSLSLNPSMLRQFKLLKLKRHSAISGRRDNYRVTCFHKLWTGNHSKWGWRFRKFRLIVVVLGKTRVYPTNRKFVALKGQEVLARKFMTISLTRALHSQCTGHWEATLSTMSRAWQISDLVKSFVPIKQTDAVL